MKKTLIVLALVAVVGIGLGLLLYNKPHQDMAGVAFYDKMLKTSPEERTKLMGKVARLSGKVQGVSSSDSLLNVFLDLGNGLSAINCQFQGDDMELAKALAEGQEVVVKGIFSGMEASASQEEDDLFAGLLDQANDQIFLTRCLVVEP